MLITNLFVFEDDRFGNFLPLVYLRPVYDLISGMSPLLAKVVRNFPEANIHLHCRDYLKNIVKQNHAGIGVNNINTGAGCLLINGRLLAESDLSKILTLDGRDRLFINNDEEVIGAYLNTDNLYIVREMMDDVFSSRKLISALRNKTEVTRVKAILLEYPWDLNRYNEEQLAADYRAVVPTGIIKGDIHSQVPVLEEYKVYVGDGTRIWPGVVLNAEKGPIYIGENCQIKPHTYIEGPVYIGNHCVVTNATLLPGTSIGPKSIVTGELQNTILHGYSKIEHAVVRSSYLAEAVDIDAHTYTRTVVLPFSTEPNIYIAGEDMDVDVSWLGIYAADFSRIGPQVIINSGTVLGISTYYEVGNDTMPRYLPSFIDQTSVNRYEELSFKEVLERADYYFKTKSLELTKADRDLLEYVFTKYAYDRKTSKIIY